MAKLTTPRSYDFRGWMDVLGNRDAVRIGHNTYAVRTQDEDGRDAVAIRLHNTNVVTFHEDGTMILNSGGYRTVTTKGRMNAVLPQRCRVWQDAFAWFVRQSSEGPAQDFHDGIVLH